jgi:pimeloyl-ACP methyl ester carboxylesterase
MELPEITPQAIAAIDIPVLYIIGDSDIVTPEHAVAMFRLLGGGVPGDLAPMPAPSSPSYRARQSNWFLQFVSHAPHRSGGDRGAARTPTGPHPAGWR